MKTKETKIFYALEILHEHNADQKADTYNLHY